MLGVKVASGALGSLRSSGQSERSLGVSVPWSRGRQDFRALLNLGEPTAER